MDIEEALRWLDRDDEYRRARRIAGQVAARLERRGRRRRAIAMVGACSGVAALFVLIWVQQPEPPAGPTRTAPVVAAVARPQVPAGARQKPVLTRKPAPPSAAQAALRFWEDCRQAGDLPAHLAATLPTLDASTLEAVRRELVAGGGSPSATAGAASWDGFATALGRSRSSHGWPLLEALLEAAGPRLAMIEAAGDLGDARAVRWLRRWLGLGDARAETAVRALGKIEGRESLGLLVETLESSRGAAAFLPRFHVETLAALARREDELIAHLDALGGRWPVACRALAELGTPAAIAALVDALEDPARRDGARQSLVRLAKQDLGAEKEAWSHWLDALAEEWSV